MDWFQNELTGDVFYISNLRQGAEKEMEKGWQWMGDNNMFMKSENDIDNAGNVLALKNGGEMQLSKSNPLSNKYDRAVFSMTLNGDDAEEFMNDRGYEKKPLEANVHTVNRNWSLPEDAPVWFNDPNEYIEKIFTFTYAKKGVNGSYSVLGNYKRPTRETNISTCSYTEESWQRRRYNYNSPQQSNDLMIKAIGFLKYLPELYTKKSKRK